MAGREWRRGEGVVGRKWWCWFFVAIRACWVLAAVRACWALVTVRVLGPRCHSRVLGPRRRSRVLGPRRRSRVLGPCRRSRVLVLGPRRVVVRRVRLLFVGRLWVVVVVAAFALPLSVVAVARIVDA